MTEQITDADVHTSGKKVVLVVNSTSRIGLTGFEVAKKQLEEDGVNIVHSMCSSDIERLLNVARTAIKDRVATLVVGGGDGTISTMAGLLANSRTALGVLPMGTGNQFARDLQLPIDIQEACKVVSKGRAIHVDLGQVEDGYFVNVLTAGLTTEIAEQLTNPLKKRFGRLAYIFAAFGGVRNLRPFSAKLETENGMREFECLQIVIGNGRLHAGPFPILPEARLRTGKFSIYALKGNSRAELLRFALMLPGGHHASLSEIHSEQARGGSLITVPRVQTIMDGELYHRSPIRFHTLPSALKVMVPAGFAD